MTDKINQMAGKAIHGVRGFLKTLWTGIKKSAAAVAVVGGLAAGAFSASAQTSPDPTTIYSTALTDFDAAVTIAITAIGIGAAIFFIRKGLKARM